MSGHCAGCVRAEPACVAHERSFVGVFESDVFVQGSSFYRSVTADAASKTHGGFGGVFSEHVVFEHVFGYAFEIALAAE